MKSTKEGKTNQNMLIDKLATAFTFPVSIYSQTIAKTEINGREAKIAPKNELFLAISEMITIKNAEIMVFVTK